MTTPDQYADQRAAIVDKTAAHVRDVLAADSSGHDWHHIQRVRRMATQLAQAEGADPFVVELAALLHDIADWKFHGGDDAEGPRRATRWLSEQGVDPQTVEHVAQIIREVSFKGAKVVTPTSSLEGQCVQDADRLDALGAIGVARAFAYGGHAGRAIYDPEAPVESHDSFAQYKKNSGPTINHFYEKLLLLRDRMNTPTARRAAEVRHRFLEQFLERFFAEWEGKP